jgi:nucleoid-associated protein YgaU
MKLRRAIAALGTVFALSFGLMLAPSQADAATLTINPRANAVEAGQVLAAPDGSVFTITVYDAGLSAGQKTVTHTFQTGDTLRQTANKIVQAINADTELQAIGVTATLQNGANYTIASTSSNGTVYKQTTTGGGSNRLAIQQTLTIGGTITVDDKVTLNIYDAGLVGGKEVVAYKPVAGDTTATIVTKLRNKINNSTTLAPLGITAKVSSTDANVLLIESPTFDATEKFTSYSAKVSAGATETVALGAFWGANGAQTISVVGPITVGETVKFSIFNVDLPDSAKDVAYVVQAGDTLNKIACGLRTEINNDSDLAEIGAHARCGAAAGGPGMLSLTSQANTAMTVWKTLTICKPVVDSPTKWPAANQVKRCGSASPANALVMRSTLEALGDQAQFPGGGYVKDAASKLSSSSQLTWYLFADHDAYYYSGYIPFFRETGGPIQVSVDLSTPLANDGTLGLILGYSIGSGGSGYSAIFETSKDQYTVGSGIQNPYIDHATAHESGHHIDAWSGAKISDSSGFQTAWQRDMAGLTQAKPCNYEAPVENSNEMVHRSGVFSSAIDNTGAFICGSDGMGETSSHGGDSLTVLKSAYPYFGQANLPPREVFPELFADAAQYVDTYTPSSNISGSYQVRTSQALVCTNLYVITWAEFGRDPTPTELHGVGYSFPAGTQTGFLHCDGATTYEDNGGS